MYVRVGESRLIMHSEKVVVRTRGSPLPLAIYLLSLLGRSVTDVRVAGANGEPGTEGKTPPTPQFTHRLFTLDSVSDDSCEDFF